MAVDAIGWQSEKDLGLMTSCAVHATMSSGQREIHIVLEIRRSPTCGNMAALAIGQPVLGGVIRGFGSGDILPMAPLASRIRAGKVIDLCSGMTREAGSGNVGAR